MIIFAIGILTVTISFSFAVVSSNLTKIADKLSDIEAQLKNRCEGVNR